jgi:glycosyltransferase involved in cell wall biosynthesis
LAAEDFPTVLAITSELPWPLTSGGRLRTFYLLRALTRRYQVRLVTAVRDGQEAGIAVLANGGLVVHPARVPPRARWREALRVLGAALRREPYVFYRRHDCRPVRRVLRDQLGRGRVDLLYLDHLDAHVFRKFFPRVPVVMDLHNIYSTLARRVAGEQASWLRRVYLRREASLLEKMERWAAQRADVLLTVSADERDHYEALGAKAVYLVPNGVDCSAFQGWDAGRPAGRPLVLYLGAMSWGPNVSAAQFLAREVLPRVRLRLPEACLRIVGRDPAPTVRELANMPGVEVTGEVPDVRPHLREATVLAVPLEAGGGTRLKILEAFAAGLPVVSTPVGCEGLGVTSGEELLMVERDRFPAAVSELLQDRSLRHRLASRARALVQERYDWAIVGEAACSALATVSGGDRPRRPHHGVGPAGSPEHFGGRG